MAERLKKGRVRYWLAFLLLFWQGTALAQIVSYGVEKDIFHPVYAKSGMVSSDNSIATRGLV